MFNQDDFGIRPQDPFNVFQPDKLSVTQLEVLNRLITPLIGTQAIGVYHYLSQFANSSVNHSTSHYVIMSELKINLWDFREEMNRLEAIGLIKTYVKHGKENSHFVYELIQPPTPKQFFNDPMLSVYLYKEVDKKRFQELKHYFERQQMDLSNYQEVTRNFTDVFKVPNQAFDAIQKNDIPQTASYKGINLDRVHFDFETLYQLLSNHFVSSEIVEEQAKGLITQLAVLYGITPEGMKGLILKSLTSGQRISYEELRKQARSFYAIEHENQLPALESKVDIQPSPVQKQEVVELTQAPQTPEEFESWFELMDSTSPIDMLASWSKSEPTLKQKYMIEDLMVREQLPFGVINILLQYVMLNNDMQLPKSYIQEIASNWKKKELASAEQAYHHVKEMKKAEKQRKTKQNNNQRNFKNYGQQVASKEITPEWLIRGDHKKRRGKQNKPQTDSGDQSLAQDRAEFLKHLNETWKEDDE